MRQLSNGAAEVRPHSDDDLPVLRVAILRHGVGQVAERASGKTQPGAEGPADETAQCRCPIQWETTEEGDDHQEANCLGAVGGLLTDGKAPRGSSSVQRTCRASLRRSQASSTASLV